MIPCISILEKVGVKFKTHTDTYIQFSLKKKLKWFVFKPSENYRNFRSAEIA